MGGGEESDGGTIHFKIILQSCESYKNKFILFVDATLL